MVHQLWLGFIKLGVHLLSTNSQFLISIKIINQVLNIASLLLNASYLVRLLVSLQAQILLPNRLALPNKINGSLQIPLLLLLRSQAIHLLVVE